MAIQSENLLHISICPQHDDIAIVPVVGQGGRDEFICTLCLCGMAPRDAQSLHPEVLTEGEKMIWAAAYAWNVAEFGADCAQAAHDAVVQARKDLTNTGGHPLDMLRAMVGR
jgi:hypothetical protein